MIASKEFVIRKLTELITNPKKKYSQNFLIDSTPVKKAIDALNKDSELVLEIGPGLGALSEEILNRGYNLVAFEIDQIMINHLKDQFKNRLFTLIEGDFLKQDLKNYQNKNVSVISNLPYALTTPIIEKIITAKLCINEFVFMIQKEVEQRLRAKNNTKDCSPLSYMFEYLGKLEQVCKVNRSAFLPAPNVDSVILKLTFNQNRDFEKEKALYKLLNASFKMRRKTIYNNLLTYFGSKEKTEEVLTSADIALNKRPEQLSLKDYLNILKFNK